MGGRRERRGRSQLQLLTGLLVLLQPTGQNRPPAGGSEPSSSRRVRTVLQPAGQNRPPAGGSEPSSSRRVRTLLLPMILSSHKLPELWDYFLLYVSGALEFNPDGRPVDLGPFPLRMNPPLRARGGGEELTEASRDGGLLTPSSCCRVLVSSGLQLSDTLRGRRTIS
ncbi:hypothetical protein EYF80_061846 [Liparis tanakae]|uniref:Uncharacterized protein n=1 Tax=Liparis tanakae TaxID=230148 RepID=A0A4Z2EGL2_9TELE|nr:hypothetical protein EYF80_061846 [Liparis tanakae]